MTLCTAELRHFLAGSEVLFDFSLTGEILRTRFTFEILTIMSFDVVRHELREEGNKADGTLAGI